MVMKRFFFALLLSASATFAQNAWYTTPRAPQIVQPYPNAITRPVAPDVYNTQLNDGSSATSRRIGPNTYTQFSDGSTANTTQIGPQTWTRFSDGRTCQSHSVGNATYTNCY
jgi:hypothetical protein